MLTSSMHNNVTAVTEGLQTYMSSIIRSAEKKKDIFRHFSQLGQICVHII